MELVFDESDFGDLVELGEEAPSGRFLFPAAMTREVECRISSG